MMRHDKYQKLSLRGAFFAIASPVIARRPKADEAISKTGSQQAAQSPLMGLLRQSCFGFASQSFLAMTLTWIVIICHCYADNIKQPYASGNFYPDNSAELSAMIDGFFAAASPAQPQGRVFALIAPHAGYGYSGRTAAFGYKLIKDKPYKTVVVIGSAHSYGFAGVSVYPEGVFRTPLGDLEIDVGFAKQLLGKDADIGFIPEAFAQEHSVEVQLPFLQKTLSDFKIVPIVIGDCPLSTCRKLAVLLEGAIAGRDDVLVVASTDMYHGYSLAEDETIDQRTISCLKSMNAEALYYGLREGKFQLCGGLGVVTALILSEELGHHKLDVLNYTNSALATGRKTDGEWTVGYVSCAIDQPGATETNGEKAMLNQQQRKKLLSIARKAIEQYLATGSKLEVNESDPLLNKEMGAFVTLNESGELRGCIGNIAGRGPLYRTVRDMAVESAAGDPRFAPVEAAELKNIEIEISVLSPPELADSPDRIILGKHGVIVRRGFNSGVFLPQVATETGWSKEKFLSNLCAHKAGLAPDAWKDPSTEIYIFSAEVFSEKHH